MSQSIQLVFDRFPLVKKKHDNDSVILNSNTDNIFHQLVLFMEDPEQRLFNINLLYQHLDGEDLEFALQVLNNFFYNDTDLINEEKTYAIENKTVKESELFNTVMFADYLKENGYNYSPQKVSVYKKRSEKNTGNRDFPKGDLTVGNITYWFKSTVDSYLKLLKEK